MLTSIKPLNKMISSYKTLTNLSLRIHDLNLEGNMINDLENIVKCPLSKLKTITI